MISEKASLAQLWERRRELCHLKHQASPGRRITWIERELGKIKRELNRRGNMNTKRFVMTLLLAALVVQAAEAGKAEKILTCTYVAMLTADVEITAANIGECKTIVNPDGTTSNIITKEINPVMRLLAGDSPVLIRLFGYGGGALALTAVHKALPKKWKLPALAALNAGEIWALWTWRKEIKAVLFNKIF